MKFIIFSKNVAKEKLILHLILIINLVNKNWYLTFKEEMYHVYIYKGAVT